MIDLHSHILPGLDDGARTMDDAIAMAEAAVAEGIRLLAATPHHNNERYMNAADRVLEAVNALNRELADRRIPLTIIPGQEVRVNDRFWNEVRLGHTLTLHHSRYLLVEPHPVRLPKDFAETVYELTLADIVPIIAHPERHPEFARDPVRLEELIALGALAQVTTHSLCGFFGRKVRKLALEWCGRNLIHLLASDAHDPVRRPFSMKAAIAAVRRELGAEYAAYYAGNAAAVADNRDIGAAPPPVANKRRISRW